MGKLRVSVLAPVVDSPESFDLALIAAGSRPYIACSVGKGVRRQPQGYRSLPHDENNLNVIEIETLGESMLIALQYPKT